MASDGYEWLERFDKKILKKHDILRRLLLFYFMPFFFEKIRYGCIYRILGVHVFGKYLPTGGINIRRWTGKKMQAYTLKSKSLESVKSFRYKSCFFELLHMPFFLFMLGRAIWWYVDQGSVRLASELMIVNAIFNIYPMMHQRYTRLRILRIIELKRK